MGWLVLFFYFFIFAVFLAFFPFKNRSYGLEKFQIHREKKKAVSVRFLVPTLQSPQLSTFPHQKVEFLLIDEPIITHFYHRKSKEDIRGHSNLVPSMGSDKCGVCAHHLV